MKRTTMKWTVLFATAFTLMATMLAHLASAGFEPATIEPQLNQLQAQTNVLQSANRRLIRSMDQAAGDPTPALTGALNYLGAINRQLVAVDLNIGGIIEEVMGFEPSPFADLDALVDAVAGANAAAQAIVDEIQARLGTEPSPFLPEYANALLGTQGFAQTISTNTQTYIGQITCDGGMASCPVFETLQDCEAYFCCEWTQNDAFPDGFCDFDPGYVPARNLARVLP